LVFEFSRGFAKKTVQFFEFSRGFAKKTVQVALVNKK
jgi:hypothetical protein